MRELLGTGVALVTPFNEDKSVDFNGLERLVNFQIENGVNYLVVLGTTGEPATLTVEEKEQVKATIKKLKVLTCPLFAPFFPFHRTIINQPKKVIINILKQFQKQVHYQ